MSIVSLKDHQLSALKAAQGHQQACGLIDLLEQAGFEAYIVGGCVRDVLLGRELKDFDMCSSATPTDMKRIFKDYKLLLQGEDFGTVSVVLGEQSFEITTFRSDGVYSNSRHPDDVKFGATLKEDVLRRDFTINALAFHPKKGVIDFVGGLRDIELKVLKTVGDPIKRFSEDVLRVARLIRFSVSLGFRIDDSSLDAAKDCSKSLMGVSKERIFSEFKKMLSGEVSFMYLDEVLGTSFCTQFKESAQLSDWEKAFVASALCEHFKIDPKIYILEKALREMSAVLRILRTSADFKKDFIGSLDKFRLYGDEQISLWSLVLMLRSDLKTLKVKSYAKTKISKKTKELSQIYQGPNLGEELFKFKVESFFVG